MAHLTSKLKKFNENLVGSAGSAEKRMEISGPTRARVLYCGEWAQGGGGTDDGATFQKAEFS